MKYPIGTQDFETIRREGMVYIDKTALVYDLVTNHRYVFLSRPRRFGKSLLLSTIKAYFEGKKELFDGLEIQDFENDWQVYPVVHLDLSSLEAGDTEALRERINSQFKILEKKFDINNPSTNLSVRFYEIILAVFNKTGQRVVVLIDEYDNPLINTFTYPEVHETNRELLKSIYSNLKVLDSHIRFAMLTGVSRFTKMSVFSGLNNLFDISFSNQYATICGITSDEVRKNLDTGIEQMAESTGSEKEETYADLKQWYDGYHFSEICPDIYNPFSLLNAFANNKISDYWFATGTPTFLVEKLYALNVDLKKYFESEVVAPELKASDTHHSSLLALLYQTGYLTIKGYDKDFDSYKLGIPNKEVRAGLFRDIMAVFQEKDKSESFSLLKGMVKSLRSGDADEFVNLLKIYFASIPYRITQRSFELFFENNIYILLNLIGIYCEVETATSNGRTDIIIRDRKYIYVIELKVDKTAEVALRQIEEKEYYLPFLKEDKTIYLIGINLSSKTRNIDSYKIKQL